MSHTAIVRSKQTLRVVRAEDLRVVNGANLGDPLGFAEELVPDDIYRLSQMAVEAPLTVLTDTAPPFRIAKGSDLGQPGAGLYLDCRVTFMSGTGQTAEALVLVETDPRGDVAQVYMLPLTAMSRTSDYVLVGINLQATLPEGPDHLHPLLPSHRAPDTRVLAVPHTRLSRPGAHNLLKTSSGG